MTTAPCKGCGKPIVWATLRVGDEITSKHIPLDPLPPIYALVPTSPVPGNTDRLCERVGRRGSAIELFVSHFATCSHANEFSGSKKGATDG